MRRITFSISGETDEDGRRLEDAIDGAAEALKAEHPKAAFSVRYERDGAREAESQRGD